MKVLIAEDDPIARRLLERHLAKNGFEAVTTRDGQQAWAAFHSGDAPRLAVLDWEMPGMDGPQVCREVRKRTGQPYVYILLLTARGEKAEVIQGLEAGADDYLVKPFHPQELLARLRTGVRILTLEDNLVAAREALCFQATHDSLTGLWNRPAVLQALGREVARSCREHRPLGVLLADLDRFKSVNDTYGHLAGDEVLRETARRLLPLLREYDAVGRYGGEEFLIVLPGCNAVTTRNRAEELRAAVALMAVQTADGQVCATLSLGAVCCQGTGLLEPAALLRAADAALYRAKAAGRNCVQMATPEEIGASTRAPAPEQLAPQVREE